MDNHSPGVTLIAAERYRQQNVKGWTAEHDNEHADNSLVYAAHAYLTETAGFAGESCGDRPPPAWPWEPEAWKPSPDPVRNLVKAGALIAAEIDRLMRRTFAEQGRS